MTGITSNFRLVQHRTFDPPQRGVKRLEQEGTIAILALVRLKNHGPRPARQPDAVHGNGDVPKLMTMTRPSTKATGAADANLPTYADGVEALQQ